MTGVTSLLETHMHMFALCNSYFNAYINLAQIVPTNVSTEYFLLFAYD